MKTCPQITLIWASRTVTAMRRDLCQIGPLHAAAQGLTGARPPEEPDREFPLTLDLRRPEPIEYRPPAPVKESASVGRVPAGAVE